MSKSSQLGQLTAYVLDCTGIPYVKGGPQCTAGEALESLLEALAELTGEKLAERLERFEQSLASNASRDGSSSRDPETDDNDTTADAANDGRIGGLVDGESPPRHGDDGFAPACATDSNPGAVNRRQHTTASLHGGEFQDLVKRAEVVLMQTGMPYRARAYSYTSENGHIYTTYDGSCGGFGPNALVQYCAG